MSMFVRTNSAIWESANQSDYKDSIVFIEDTEQIYSNGLYYGGENNNGLLLEKITFSEESILLNPDKFYVSDTVLETLDITLNGDTTRMNTYFVEFTCDNACVILPSNIKWKNNIVPDFTKTAVMTIKIQDDTAYLIDCRPLCPHYVTFTALGDDSSIGLARLSRDQIMEYSTDIANWSTFDTSTNISLNNGDKVYVRGILNVDNVPGNITQFEMSGKIAASGNCNAIWNYQDLNASLKAYCGYGMFKDCTSLITAPELPATVLAEKCYYSMFSGCTSLVTAPELPATELADYCYQSMFTGCTSLTTAPELPATELASYCYGNMFYGCSSLTIVPKILPATLLADYCYNFMFCYCTSLTTTPELPAMELTDCCYYGMFMYCTSLTTAPELPAMTLAEGCYSSMFSGCTSLNYIKCLATDISASGCTTSWVYGVASTGTFIQHPSTMWSTGVNSIPRGWKTDNAELPYVTFTAQQDNSSIRLEELSTNQTLEYSTSTTAWKWKPFNKSTIISLNKGNKVHVRGILSADNTSYDYTQFQMSGKIVASGNCNAIWNYKDLNAPLKVCCGFRMFQDCRSLTAAPELPATILARGCYNNMFYSCASLTIAPELPATMLTDYCYSKMFCYCRSLTAAPKILPATTLATMCYYSMFYECSSLTTAPELPATTLADNCYQSMFENCTSLTTAPELPATTLTEWCYSNMFYYCTKLNHIKCLATDISASSCTGYWVYEVASAGTFIKHPDATWSTGASGIPSGWRVENAEI